MRIAWPALISNFANLKKEDHLRAAGKLVEDADARGLTGGGLKYGKEVMLQ